MVDSFICTCVEESLPNLRLTDLTRTQRLTFATVCAAALHVLLFASGWLVIQKISIPSNQNRTMVLTLEATPLDGLVETEQDNLHTLNDVKLGEAAQQESRPIESDLSQLTTVAHVKPTFDTQPEVMPEPLPELESVSELAVETPLPKVVSEEVTPSRPQLDQLDSLNQQSPLFDQQPSLAAPATTDDLRLLLADSAPLAINANQTASTEPGVEQQPVSTEQQSMLQRKLENWVSRIDDQEQLNETYSWQHKGQTYSAKFSHLPAAGEMQLDEIRVAVTTQQNGQAVSTTMRLKKLAFSNFAQFVHRWNPDVSMHNDELRGRFHSNSKFLLDSDRRTRPVFHGKVTTASNGFSSDRPLFSATRQDIFRGGIETGVKRIKMPKPQLLFNPEMLTAGQETIRFEQDTRIVFTPEGGFLAQPAEEIGAPRYHSLPDLPTYLIANKGVTLYISGEVRGKVMLYSPERVVIESSLRYAAPDIAESDDVIGVISAKNIEIAEPEMTGSGDLTIHASLYAGRMFKVRNYRNNNDGTLHIFGSLSAGSLGATQPRYASSIVFDDRFERLRPPGFPVTDRYEVEQADETWSTN